jgi:hypothetical protein
VYPTGPSRSRRAAKSRIEGAEPTSEKHERVVVGRNAHGADLPDDDPVIAGGMLDDDLAFERGEGVGEQRYAVASGLPIKAGEAVRAGRGRTLCEALLVLPEMFTPKRRARRMRDHVSELRAGQNDTRGGSSETDVSEFTIKPAGAPSGAAVTNATPVANLASASRNERASGAAATGAGAASVISMEGRRFAESDAGEVVVGAIRAERVHEGAGLDVAVCARQRAAVDVAGAA